MPPSSNIPNWFWATLAIIVVATVGAIIYCNQTSALYNQSVKNDLTTANSQTGTNTSTSNTSSNTTPQASTTEQPATTNSMSDQFAALINM